MPRKPSQTNEESEEEKIVQLPKNQGDLEDLSRMLASVLDYLSDDENEEIDIEYIFDKTEGLREWWTQYRENNKKVIEEKIKESLSDLSFEELQKIYEQIKES
ncbi:5'-deoxynucleotidase YfbR-like HD superfamily hydrolase [Lysinibacillus composti]|uniref:Uncharacterized protein n=1 Tax=Lysinibacillus composti TaxID=720633 RepID=A0A3N9UM97_9BACI|nr:hypothetical protein [Lysinibacillus composti]MBM7609721.1 5'-deoxynucleotidase YfbR-like HD superfamily hydrolase [Lysinibacillus composti]RQW73642.1 hypothetical protein EBB45_15440 [Lysinibacillus composti]